MIEAGILLGLGREVSTQLVVQTMLGTAKLLRDENAPTELRRQHVAGRHDDPGDPRARQAGVRARSSMRSSSDGHSRELANEAF
jgi:hypothetical protein